MATNKTTSSFPVNVVVDKETAIRFKNVEDFAAWLAEVIAPKPDPAWMDRKDME